MAPHKHTCVQLSYSLLFSRPLSLIPHPRILNFTLTRALSLTHSSTPTPFLAPSNPSSLIQELSLELGQWSVIGHRLATTTLALATYSHQANVRRLFRCSVSCSVCGLVSWSVGGTGSPCRSCGFNLVAPKRTSLSAVSVCLMTSRELLWSYICHVLVTSSSA